MLKKLKEDTGTDGSDLLVFYVPQKAAVYDDLWERMAQYYDLSESEWSRDRIGQVLTQSLEQLEIRSINPLEQMRQRQDNNTDGGGRLYYEQDGHWDPKGNQFVAEILTEYIMDNLLGSR